MKRTVCCLVGIIGILVATVSPVRATTTFAYVPNHGDNTVTRIKTDDLTFDKLNLPGGPYGAVVAADGAFVLVTCHENGTLARITNTDFETGAEPATIAVGVGPAGVTIAPQGGFAYVANNGDNTVSEISLAGNNLSEIDTIAVGRAPWGIVAVQEPVSNTAKVYVANHEDGTISVITKTNGSNNVRTIDVIGTSPQGTGPVGMTASPDGRHVYVANYAPIATVSNVAIIRTRDDTVIQRVPVERGAWGVALGSQGDFLYVTNSLSNSVSVIRTNDHLVVRTFAVGPEPLGVSAPRNGNVAFTVNQNNTLSKIDIMAQTVTAINNIGIFNAFALGAFIGGRSPAVPTGLSGEPVSYDRVQLSWVHDGPTPFGFTIDRRGPGQEDFFELIQVSGDTTAYKDQPLASETTYAYRVRAFTEAAESAPTTAIEVTTGKGSFSWCFIGTLLP